MRNFTDPCYWIIQISILTDKIYDRTIGELAYELMRDFSETLLAYSQRSDLPVKYKNMVERNLHYDRYIEVTDKFKEEYSKEKLPYVFSGWGAYPFNWHILDDIRCEISTVGKDIAILRELDKLLEKKEGWLNIYYKLDSFKQTADFKRIIDLLSELVNCHKPDISDVLWPKGLDYTERVAKIEYEIRPYSADRLKTLEELIKQNSILSPEALAAAAHGNSIYLHNLFVALPSLCIADENTLEEKWLSMLSECLSKYGICTGYLNKDIANSIYSPWPMDDGEKVRGVDLLMLTRAYPKHIARSCWATGAVESQLGELCALQDGQKDTPFFQIRRFANGNALFVKTRHANHAEKEQMNAIARFIYPYTRKYKFSFSRFRQIPSLRMDLGMGTVRDVIHRDTTVSHHLMIENILV